MNTDKFEQHSFNSLSKRLGRLVSRQTLTEWIKAGVIKPTMMTKTANSTHLLFPKTKLAELHALLKEARDERIAKQAPSAQAARRMARIGEEAAAVAARTNEKRIKKGLKPIREPNPAMDDDDAAGITRLTLTPDRIENVQKIFSGYGLYR